MRGGAEACWAWGLKSLLGLGFRVKGFLRNGQQGGFQHPLRLLDQNQHDHNYIDNWNSDLMVNSGLCKFFPSTVPKPNTASP